MDMNKKLREHISALMDGALPDADLELALAAVLQEDGAAAWARYHRIGDVLRAMPTADLSDGFARQLAQRLAEEPLPLRRQAPAASPPLVSVLPDAASS